MDIPEQIRKLNLRFVSLDREWDRCDSNGQVKRQSDIAAEMLVLQAEVVELEKSLADENITLNSEQD